MKVYDYMCEHCCVVHEHFVKDSEVRTVKCRECGNTAHRMIPRPRFQLDGTDPAYPTAWDKWAKDREVKAKQANKQAEEHGE